MNKKKISTPNRAKTLRPSAPGPAYATPLSLLADMRRDLLGFYLNAATFGDVVRIHSGPWGVHAVFHPAQVQHVLQDQHQTYTGAAFLQPFKIAFGAGLTFSEGAAWRQQRRLLQPVFQRHHMASWTHDMTQIITTVLDSWQPMAERAAGLDMFAELNRLTVLISGKILFDIDFGPIARTVEQALSHLREHFNTRFLQALSLSESLPSPANYTFWQTVRTLETLAYEMIAKRRPTLDPHGLHKSNDLLSRLLHAQALSAEDPSRTRLSDTHIRDEILTFLIGATGTTAVVIAWTCYVLTLFPAVNRRLREEVSQVLHGRLPSVEDLPRLSYTRMVIQEVLRLYPPNWLTVRTALADDEIAGYPIPASSLVVLSPYVTHRHPACWDQPDQFCPERFGSEQIGRRPRYAYFPFGGGPRQCIGNEFAMLAAQLIVVLLVQRYQLRLLPGQTIEPDPLLALRPRYGLRMAIHKA